MDLLEQVAVYIIATVFQLPYLITVGYLWVIAAVVAWIITRRLQSRSIRAALRTLPLAIGLAPMYGFHLSMMPAFTLLIEELVSPLEAATSMLITWVVLFLIYVAVAHRFSRRSRPPATDSSMQK
jgi:hypothetical protein